MQKKVLHLCLAAFIAVIALVAVHSSPEPDSVASRIAAHIPLSEPLEAQAPFAGFSKAFTAQTTTGATTGFAARGILSLHTINLVVTGAPATCTYQAQGSAEGTVWFNLSSSAITCTSTIVTFEANKPTRYIRGNLLTLTGGTSPTITLRYLGK